MITPTRIFETNASELRNLDKEHAEIGRRYTGLEKVIVRGQGLPRILEAADSLVQIMFLHLAHEEEFLSNLPLNSRFQERHRDASIEVTARLFGIEAGLQQGQVAAVFHLLRIVRFWMKEHMELEIDGEPVSERVGGFQMGGPVQRFQRN
jgi:hemerythrin